jgi:DNA polymerase III alpha subunit
LGDKAIEQIINNRPFNTPEELLFNEDIAYSKLNKKALHALCLSGALDTLCDERFNGCKHFWMSCVQNKPKSVKKLLENIKEYSNEEDFSIEEKIEHVSSLTGIFPFDLVMTKALRESIKRYAVPPIGAWDKKLGVAWFIPREIIPKVTKNGKLYWIVKVIDDASSTTSIKCWGIREGDQIHLNRPYAAKLDHSEDWGFSTRSIRHTFRLLG